MKLFYSQIDCSFTDELMENWLQLTKKRRIKQIRDMTALKQSLLGDMLTRKVISQHYGMPFEEISYIYNAFEKPYIEVENCYFNCSHSENGVFVVIDDGPVGIDAEKVKPLESLKEISEIIFTDREKEDFEQLSQSGQLDFMYQAWTIKESYLKLLGTGLNIPPDQVAIDFLHDKVAGTHIEKQYPAANFSCSRKEDFIYTIASAKTDLSRALNKVTISEIADFIEQQ